MLLIEYCFLWTITGVDTYHLGRSFFICFRIHNNGYSLNKQFLSRCFFWVCELAYRSMRETLKKENTTISCK
jgi:hypothetical protein